MSNLNREIESEVTKINTFVEEKLSKDKLLIPTFQRDFVWEPENIRRLWDSIFSNEGRSSHLHFYKTEGLGLHS